MEMAANTQKPSLSGLSLFLMRHTNSSIWPLRMSFPLSGTGTCTTQSRPKPDSQPLPHELSHFFTSELTNLFLRQEPVLTHTSKYTLAWPRWDPSVTCPGKKLLSFSTPTSVCRCSLMHMSIYLISVTLTLLENLREEGPVCFCLFWHLQSLV